MLCAAGCVTYLVIITLSRTEMFFCEQEAHGTLRFCQLIKCALTLMSLECWWLTNQRHLKSTQTEKRKLPWMSLLLVH